MSSWKIAAAQYESLHNNVAEHVARHLRFIHAAAAYQSEVLVFPELSLSGPLTADYLLPAPPDDGLLQPLSQACHQYGMIIIAGLPVQQEGMWCKGIAAFVPWKSKPLKLLQGQGVCLAPHLQNLIVCDKEAQGIDIDPQFSLLVSGKHIAEAQCHKSMATLQRFSHKYAIAVLMANSHGGSALWDEAGQLIVRADRGSLLVTGHYDGQGWQGDIIPLR